MNAYCTYDDDSTYFGFAEPNDAGYDSAGYESGRDDFGTGCMESAEALALYGMGPDLDELDSDTHDLGGDFSEDWQFEDADAVERHAMRRATEVSIVDAVAERVQSGEAEESDAIALLTWSAPHLSTNVRATLAETLASEGGDSEGCDAGTALALWRGGPMDRDELRRTAREFLEAARVQLAVEAYEDARVIEGPWRRGTPPLERTHQLHVLYLAVRHAELRLDEVDEQVAELWQEELRSELSARQRETRREALDPATGDEHFAESVHLVAAAAEMWRDTAPAARPVRLPLEKLTRLLWQAARQRRLRRPERAALLIAAGNQRLDDLPSKPIEAGLYADDEANRTALNATWVGGRRPSITPQTAPKAATSESEMHLATEALVLRALSGPARTGPRRS